MPIEDSENDLDALIEEASRIQIPEGPKRLLVALTEMKDPLACDEEAARIGLLEAQQIDFGAIYRYRWSGHPLTKEDRRVWVDLLAWLLHALEACQQQRPSMITLVAILRVGSAFASDMPIWQRLPLRYLNDNLLASMAAVVGSTQCSFGARGQAEPIWEREAVDSFLQADADSEWPKIENLWQTVVSAVRPDGDIAEATACLCACEKGLHALALALDACTSIFPIIIVANAMTSAQIGKVAVLVNSNRARFALVQSLAFNHPGNEPLQAATLENLAKLFREIQKDDVEWLKWTRAFNRYPIRTKALQPAFGISLAGSGEEAKTAYIKAIDLSTANNGCRVAVTLCLSEFRRYASDLDRQSMWMLALRRWELWDFDRDNANHPLTSMAVSELDFALIGYGVECLSETDLQIKIHVLWADLTTVQNNWYADRGAFDAAWYRALSRWQVFAYAAEVRAGKHEWKIPSVILVPFDAKSDRYLAMSLNTNLPHGSKA